MTLRTLRLSSLSAFPATGLAVVLTLGSLAGTPASAARLGHTRVVSAQNAPLQVLVGISDLSPDEQDTLKVTLADAASWQRAGLTPPVPLSSITLRVENGSDRSSKVVRLTSTEVAANSAVDVLLDLGSSAGQRQVQVTVMQTATGFPGLTSQATVGTPSRAGRGTAGVVGVKQGDTLYGIAQSRSIADATIYQMLVALWRANPGAFLQNNMNLVKAGATLTVPDAATVRAVDPAEARRIFLEQAEAYARYRASLAAAAGKGAAVSSAPASSGQVSNATPAPPPEPSTQDRVRLSSGQPGQGGAAAQAQAQADADTSMAKATKDAESRVDVLERNVKDLNAAVAASRGQKDSAAGGAQVAAGAGSGGDGAAGVPGAAGSAGYAGAPGQQDGAGAAGGTGNAGVAAGTGAAASGMPGSSAASGAPGAAGSPGASGASTPGGASGTSAASGTPGSSGAPDIPGASTGSGTSGGSAASATPGAAVGAGASAASGATTAPRTPGIAGDAAPAGGSPGVAGVPGSPGMAGSAGITGAGASSGTGITGPAGSSAPSASRGIGDAPAGAAAKQPGAEDAAPFAPARTDTSGLPAWLSDNLLIIVTGVLALIAFVIAWLLRRVAARRDDDAEDLDDDVYMAEMDHGTLSRRLDDINLDLDQPPSDDGRREPGVVRP